MNRIILVGRTTKEIELRTTASGKITTSFCIAVDRRANKSTDFIDCIAWGKTAELLRDYVRKGEKIGIEGSLQTRTYEDKNGNKRKAVEVLVDSMEFLEPKNQAPEETTAPAEPVAPAEPTPEEPGELPFEI